MKHSARKENTINQLQLDSRYWGNPIDVPNYDLEKLYSKKNGGEKEENEREILIKSFHLPTKSKLKRDFLSGKSKKILSVSRPTLQQQNRRHRRQQTNLDFGADCSLEGHYHFIENSSNVHSRSGTKARKKTKARKAPVEKKQSNTLKAVQKSGLVNTKISIYEKNLNNANDNYNLQLRNSRRKQKKAVLGVPLIGMHDTDPIAPAFSSSWKNYGTRDPLQLYITNTKAAHLPKFPSKVNLNKQREQRTTTKRKAPSIPDSAAAGRSKEATSNKKEQALNGFKKSSLGKSTLSYPTKFTKNPYFINKDGQVKYGRDLHQLRQAAKISSATMRPHSAFERLPGSGAKRQTLYAKGTDRDEAIRVLTNLCLNPLARNNRRASFMMW